MKQAHLFWPFAVLSLVVAWPSAGNAHLLTGWFNQPTNTFRPIFGGQTTLTTFRPVTATVFRPAGCSTCPTGVTALRPVNPVALRPFGVTAYRPIMAATVLSPVSGCNSCNTCLSPVSCNPGQSCSTTLTPQTTFRQVTVNVPVTTYRPVVSRDPCTGCAVTTMRPVTTFVQQCRQVPVTSYRPVTVCRPACPTACSPCATAACPGGSCSAFSTNMVGTTLSSPGCSTCNIGGSATGTPMTVAPHSGSPMTVAPGGGQTQPQPSSPPQTFAPQRPVQEDQPQAQPQPQEQTPTLPRDYQEPTGNGAASRGSSTRNYVPPRLLDPDSRTTQRPQNEFKVFRAVHVVPTSQDDDMLDPNGWKPLR